MRTTRGGGVRLCTTARPRAAHVVSTCDSWATRLRRDDVLREVVRIAVAARADARVVLAPLAAGLALTSPELRALVAPRRGVDSSGDCDAATGLGAAADAAVLRVARACAVAARAPPSPHDIALCLTPLLPPLVASAVARYGLFGAPGGTGRSPAGGLVVGPGFGWFARGTRLPAAGAGGGAAACDAAALSPPLPAGPRRRVGVFGGSFSPPTEAHVAVVCDVAGSGAVDEVWVVPCGPRADKRYCNCREAECACPPVPCAGDRYLMALLAVEARVPLACGGGGGGCCAARVAVVPLEAWEPGALPSYELMRRLAALEPRAAFALVVGADLLPTLPAWRDADALLAEVAFLAVPRPPLPPAPGAPGVPPLSAAAAIRAPARLAWVARRDGSPLCDVAVSSTDVRARLRAAAAQPPSAPSPVAGLVPPQVAAFIARQGLYV